MNSDTLKNTTSLDYKRRRRAPPLPGGFLFMKIKVQSLAMMMSEYCFTLVNPSHFLMQSFLSLVGDAALHR